MSKIEGIYAMYFTGRFGSGMGLMFIKDKIIKGADEGGVIYDGSYEEKDDGLIGTCITMSLPSGGNLVTGFVAGQEPQTHQIAPTFPPNFGEGRFFKIDVVGGSVNIIFRKIRDLS